MSGLKVKYLHCHSNPLPSSSPLHSLQLSLLITLIIMKLNKISLPSVMDNQVTFALSFHCSQWGRVQRFYIRHQVKLKDKFSEFEHHWKWGKCSKYIGCCWSQPALRIESTSPHRALSLSSARWSALVGPMFTMATGSRLSLAANRKRYPEYTWTQK